VAPTIHHLPLAAQGAAEILKSLSISQIPESSITNACLHNTLARSDL
jgi:hypothetical protein